MGDSWETSQSSDASTKGLNWDGETATTAPLHCDSLTIDTNRRLLGEEDSHSSHADILQTSSSGTFHPIEMSILQTSSDVTFHTEHEDSFDTSTVRTADQLEISPALTMPTALFRTTNSDTEAELPDLPEILHSNTDIVQTRSNRGTFHLEDSWMMVGPEEEMIFATDSEDSGSYMLSATSSCASSIAESLSCESSLSDGGGARLPQNLLNALALRKRLREQRARSLENLELQKRAESEERAQKAEERIRHQAVEQDAMAKKLEEERRQREAEAKALLEKQLEEEKRQREAEAKAKAILEQKLKEEKARWEAEARAKELLEKKLEEERRQREAEFRALEAKKLEEEKRQREAEARALEAKKLEDERRQREAEARAKALEAKKMEEERRQREAEAKALVEKQLEEERRQREVEAQTLVLLQKQLEEERRQREAEEKAKAILEKKLEDEKRQRLEEAKALEEKKVQEERRRREAEELQAKKLEEEIRQRKAAEARAQALQEKAEEERRQREAEARALEEERLQREAKAAEEKRKWEAVVEALEAKRIEEQAAAEARALEAKKEEEERLSREAEEESFQASYETLVAEELEDVHEECLVVDTIAAIDEEEVKKHVEAESQQIEEESQDAMWNRIQRVMRMNGLESIIKDTNIANNSRMAGNMIVTAVNVGLAVVGSRFDGNTKACQGPQVLDLSFVLDRPIDLLNEQMVRSGHIYSGLMEDARGLLKKNSPSKMCKRLLEKAYPTNLPTWTKANSVVGNLVLGLAATPAVCMLGSLATTAFGVGLTAFGSRVDGNIKVCQSPRALSLGFTLEQKEE